MNKPLPFVTLSGKRDLSRCGRRPPPAASEPVGGRGYGCTSTFSVFGMLLAETLPCTRGLRDIRVIKAFGLENHCCL